MTTFQSIKWGPERACLCGAPIQVASSSRHMPTRFDAGTEHRHSCGPVSWCACGEPVCTWRNGAVVNVADDQPHRCEDTRLTIRRVLVPAEMPLRDPTQPPVIRIHPAPPVERDADGFDVPEMA